jgi:HK97 family phage major capsid protein
MELKDLQTEIQKSFEQLKAAGDRQEQEIKKFGQASKETEGVIANINTEINKVKTQMDEMATKFNRPGFGTNGEPTDPKDQEKKEIFFKFMRNGIGELSREEKALVQDAAGDILVPADLDKEIQRSLQQINVIRSLASVRTTKSDRIRRVNMNELTVGWGKIETGGPKLSTFESSLVPSEAFAYVEDAYGLTKIGEDELEDSDLNLQSYLAESFGDAYANLEEVGFLKGTGHANMQPEGILNGTTVQRFLTKTAASVTADDLITIAYEVPAIARKSGTYLVNGKIEMAMRLMKDTQGQYLWQPSLQAGAPSIFNGKAVHNVEVMDGGTATGQEIAVFGDIKQAYQVLDRREGFITRINELYINDGLIGFRYKRRVGGYVKKPAALRVLKVR